MILSALRFGGKNAKNLQAVEELTTFRPFNIREVEFDVWETNEARRDGILRQYEQMGILQNQNPLMNNPAY